MLGGIYAGYPRMVYRQRLANHYRNSYGLVFAWYTEQGLMVVDLGNIMVAQHTGPWP